jgi:steroid 5-alpha reductase family enzyme
MNDVAFFAIAVGAALVVSSLGFVRVVWFISVGYGYSVSAVAAAAAVVLRAGLDPWSAVQLALLFLYGIRLGTYILLRERASSYGRERESVRNRESKVGVGMRLLIWVGVATLYAAMTSPAFLPLVDKAAGAALTGGALVPTAIGLAVMALGIGLEAAADLQKNAYKKTHPDRFCDTGVFRVSRCPNYLGEVLAWVGGFIAGTPFMSSWYRIVVPSAGLVIIVLIMLGAAKSLEEKQEKRYGADPEYRAFVSTVPILFPVVPLRSLKRLKVYLG